MSFIAELRKKKGKTQSQIAQEVGISCRSYQEIEYGNADIRRIKESTLIGLAKALNTSIDTLLAPRIQEIQESSVNSDQKEQ